MDVTTEERMDEVSTMGYSLGYIESTIPFIICMAIVILAQYSVIPVSTSTACRISFVLTAIWWGLYTIPMIKNVRQVHGIDIEPNPLINSFKRLESTLKNIKRHKKIVWYGSINLLIYGSSEESIMRIISMNIANELLGTVENEIS